MIKHLICAWASCALAAILFQQPLAGQQSNLRVVAAPKKIMFGPPPKPRQVVKQVVYQAPANAALNEALEEFIPRVPLGSGNPARPVIPAQTSNQTAIATNQALANQALANRLLQNQLLGNQPAGAGPGATEFLALPKGDPNAEVDLKGTGDSVSLSAQGAELSAVLKLIADEHHLNLVLGPGVSGPITVSIADAKLEEVLDAILAVGGFTWHRNGTLLYVTSLNPSKAQGGETTMLDPRVQGRQVRVFPLNYVAAVEVERVVVGLLSPVGKAFISESDIADKKKTQELLVVEDVPSVLQRVGSYLLQIDQAPKQVLIEAHVLQVTLDDELRHGVNLAALAKATGSKIEFKTTGFANSNASPGATLGIDGSDLDAVVEMIRTYSNARTLASPKVLAVNRQKAKIQIGSQLGYYVTTTTQTGTFQSVEFLDTGVVLSVEPIISDSGNILMTVTPEVSGGRINSLGLPEEETTEITSTILLPDGGGVVIGGLIKDTDQDDHTLVPLLGRIPTIGKFFSRHGRDGRREEIIIALVTHIVPSVEEIREHELNQLHSNLPPHTAASLRRPGVLSEGTVIHEQVIHPPSQFETRSPVPEVKR